MSAQTRIDIAAHDAGWTIENHGYTWVYSAPEPADLAVGTQYTLTGRPRRPQIRAGGTLRPITGHDTTGQILAIIETSTTPTETVTADAAPNELGAHSPHTVSRVAQRNRSGARAVNPSPDPVSAAKDICGPINSLPLAGHKSADTGPELRWVDSPPSPDSTAPKR